MHKVVHLQSVERSTLSTNDQINELFIHNGTYYCATSYIGYVNDRRNWIIQWQIDRRVYNKNRQLCHLFDRISHHVDDVQYYILSNYVLMIVYEFKFKSTCVYTSAWVELKNMRLSHYCICRSIPLIF